MIKTGLVDSSKTDVNANESVVSKVDEDKIEDVKMKEDKKDESLEVKVDEDQNKEKDEKTLNLVRILYK